VCGDVRYKHWRAFTKPVYGSTEAEIKAVINGLFLAKTYFPNAGRFHVVSDCTFVITQIKKKTSEWWKMMKDIVGDADITGKHVKGHQGTETKRAWVNAWCNRMARRAMRKVRDYGCICKDCDVKLKNCNGDPDTCIR